MNRLIPFLIAPVLLLGGLAGAPAQTGTTTPPEAAGRGVVIANHVQAQAEVEAINYADRTVVLKGEDGSTVELKVGPQAKNFDRVKVGDRVKADFYRSTAIFLRKSSAPPSASGANMVRLAPPGGTPGGLMVSTSEMSARVDAVDPQQRVVTLTGPLGNTVSLKVGDNVENLDQIQKGDQVVVRYTEAVALTVDKD